MKPPLWSQVRGDGHWAADGLLGGFYFTEGGGATAYSLAGSYHGSVSGTVASADIRGREFTASGYLNCGKLLPSTGPFSYVVHIAGQPVFGGDDYKTFVGQGDRATLRLVGTYLLQFYTYAPGYDWSSVSLPGIVANDLRWAACSHDGSSNKIWCNLGSGVGSAARRSYSPHLDLTIGTDIENAMSRRLGPSVILSSVLVYGRALTAGEVFSLAADPILPFRRRQPVYYSVPSGGGTARNLIAALTGESATGTISAIIARALSGDVTATSITGAITASMARDLLASMQGQSATGDAAATMQRLLLASLGCASLTGDVAATMSGIVSLIAAINGQSATGTAAATQARALLADLQANSTTPDIAATLAALVALTASISGTTTTPAVAATMARALAATLAGQSTTGAIAVEFAGMLLLVASIAGTSTTGALTATTGRELRAAIATASTTGQVDGQLLRQIAATIAGASLTGAIAAELVNLVSLAASVVGVSVTPAVLATLSRDLTAEVAAGSTTGAASATVARALTAAVEAGSLTPDNLVLILTGLGILHDTTIISRTPRRGISSRTVRRTIHSA